MILFGFFIGFFIGIIVAIFIMRRLGYNKLSKQDKANLKYSNTIFTHYD